MAEGASMAAEKKGEQTEPVDVARLAEVLNKSADDAGGSLPAEQRAAYRAARESVVKARRSAENVEGPGGSSSRVLEPTLRGMTSWRLRRASSLAATVLVLVAAGCGDDSSGDDSSGDDSSGTDTADVKAVAKVMTSLDAASREGDGKRICSQLFTPKLAKSVSTASTSGDCAKEVKSKLFSPDAKISIENIVVTDEANATATVTESSGNTSTVFLVKQDGQWRIRSVVPA